MPGLHTDLQNFVIAENFLRGGLVPLAVWNLPVRDRDIEGVVDQVILKDSVIGGAGSEGRGRVHLREDRNHTRHSGHWLLRHENTHCKGKCWPPRVLGKIVISYHYTYYHGAPCIGSVLGSTFISD